MYKEAKGEPTLLSYFRPTEMGTPYPTKMFVRHLGSTTGERCIQTGFQVSPIFQRQAPFQALWLPQCLNFFLFILGYLALKEIQEN